MPAHTHGRWGIYVPARNTHSNPILIGQYDTLDEAIEYARDANTRTPQDHEGILGVWIEDTTVDIHDRGIHDIIPIHHAVVRTPPNIQGSTGCPRLSACLESIIPIGSSTPTLSNIIAMYSLILTTGHKLSLHVHYDVDGYPNTPRFTPRYIVWYPGTQHNIRSSTTHPFYAPTPYIMPADIPHTLVNQMRAIAPHIPFDSQHARVQYLKWLDTSPPQDHLGIFLASRNTAIATP